MRRVTGSRAALLAGQRLHHRAKRTMNSVPKSHQQGLPPRILSTGMGTPKKSCSHCSLISPKIQHVHPMQGADQGTWPRAGTRPSGCSHGASPSDPCCVTRDQRGERKRLLGRRDHLAATVLGGDDRNTHAPPPVCNTNSLTATVPYSLKKV